MICFATVATAQNNSITIKDPVEFNTFNSACGHCTELPGQRDPSAKASAPALESFLQSYPQSVVKSTALELLMDAYYTANDPDKCVTAASRLLQVEPNNLKAMYLFVYIKKYQGQKLHNTQTLEEAATMASRGLALPRPVGVSDTGWNKITAVFQSAIEAAQAQKPEVQAQIAAKRADQQARYDKAMHGGRPAQLYALAGDLEEEGRPEMAADLYQALIDNFPDDPYTAKAIDKREAARAAARQQQIQQQQAQQQAQQTAADAAAHQQAIADCQQQCNSVWQSCRSDAKRQSNTAVVKGVMGAFFKNAGMVSDATSDAGSADAAQSACDDANTSCTAACQ
jgi:hypothetical protein